MHVCLRSERVFTANFRTQMIRSNIVNTLLDAREEKRKWKGGRR
jgi:hypothetical protein